MRLYTQPRALVKYLEFYGLTPKPDASAEELAALVSKCVVNRLGGLQSTS